LLGKRNVFLIGPMGSGKSAVGKRLARLLAAPFFDSDHEIESRTGVDIPLIFEKEGEAGFREREREVIADLTAREPIILSTGGGAVLRPENREHLRTRGAVVYLETSVEQQAARVRRGHNRPLLANEDPQIKLQQLMLVREPLYREIADVVVCTDGCRVQDVAQQIMRELTSGAASSLRQ
jgi:shikimate kinase